MQQESLQGRLTTFKHALTIDNRGLVGLAVIPISLIAFAQLMFRL